MFKYFSKVLPLLLITCFSVLFIFTYLNLFQSNFIKFSDTAKFADVARNLYNHKTLGKSFSFFDSKAIALQSNDFFSVEGIPIANPIVSYISFKLFGISDSSVMFPSILFFVLTSIVIYLLGQKISNKTVGFVSSLAFSSNIDMIRYASEGASESFFIFQIVTSFYLLTINKKWANIMAIFFLVIMYLTRPQAFVFIFVLILYWLIINLGFKKALLTISAVGIIGLFIDIVVLQPLSFKLPVYSITARGEHAILHFSAGAASSNGLRGDMTSELTYQDVGKKLFYNVYNFYKLLPQISSPYLIALYFIGLFIWSKSITYNAFKFTVTLSFILLIFISSLTIPLIRYIHPVIPLLYILSVDTLVKIFEKIFSKKSTILLSSLLVILIFSVGQTVGILLLDSRFERNTSNFGKPPAYKVLSEILKQNTHPDDYILTNLDTWGSWYGERKTMWYPISPRQIINLENNEIPFNAIYLTSYLIDDKNYEMGYEWRQIFNNPYNSSKWICDKCSDIAKNFEFKEEYNIPASDVYEKEDIKAILLVRK